MKNLVGLGIVLLTFFTACNDSSLPDINGMWQLKTIEDANHQTQSVDTIFYSFQRQAIFSYTVVHQDKSDPPIYGFIDFPDKDHLHILLDTGSEWQKEQVLWKEMNVTYEILLLNSKYMQLSQNGIVYSFNKF
jgi:hypothetical protein